MSFYREGRRYREMFDMICRYDFPYKKGVATQNF